MLRDCVPAERYAIQEPECADDLVQSRPGDAPRHEVNLEGMDIVKAQPIRRSAKIAAKLYDCIKVGLLRGRR